MKVEVNFFAFSHQLKKAGSQLADFRQPALHKCHGAAYFTGAHTRTGPSI
jgi:hypothetical protein